MKTLRDAWTIARLEAGLFERFPTLRLSVLGVVVIPALYALIYLSSVWARTPSDFVATLLGRWRFVGVDEHRPALDL